ncbi:MAG: isochorismatase family protein [Gammaproteobacteria bacterium]|nr:isochorismatase family protein [Gammaproteobacteria bacterium]
MKQTYFTHDSIEQQTKLFLREVAVLRRMHPWKFKPKKTALLVIDMQDYFIEENSHAYIPSTNAIIPQILKLQNYFLQHDYKILHTRHTNTKINAKQMANWWHNDILTLDNHKSAITAAIAHPDIRQIVKPQYDAFLYTDLEEDLTQAKIEQVIITGIMTNLCCEATARSAFSRGFEVFFAVDATATYNQDFHLASIRNLAYGYAHPVTVEELLCQLK